MVGKWHLGSHTIRHTPTYRGFDSFYGKCSQICLKEMKILEIENKGRGFVGPMLDTATVFNKLVYKLSSYFNISANRNF